MARGAACKARGAEKVSPESFCGDCRLSFHVRPDGIWLAPHYDLRCTGSHHTKAFADERATWSQAQMTFPLPGAQTFGEATLGTVLAAAQQLGMHEFSAQGIVQEVSSRADKVFAIIVYTAVEARLLWVIQHITLKNMLLRLRYG